MRHNFHIVQHIFELSQNVRKSIGTLKQLPSCLLIIVRPSKTSLLMTDKSIINKFITK